ncbi:hypothetical protein [Archaeoglobus profundus]|uniref:Uncharacterized protein n=1 Tax=Archaeoglobus profundus (strain DSM 5631 / JCM 9629 / NBRC 100127 / Av18) TaxID=572546 RepID=D2RFB5_ARCPA|nr:hypothetical protein [Archaeoglobus profundus]ADB58809.1 hypothetical protein Arcpr_1765 [Archaeoglobus profundus DSM 5631]
MNRTLSPPLPPEAIKKRARDVIRKEIGTIPSPGEPRLVKIEIDGISRWVYEVPIVVYHPVLIVDPVTHATRKVRFKNLGVVGKIVIDAYDGTVLERTTVSDIRRKIKQRLNEISTLVDKLLVKVEAKKFASLPLSEHIHTPVEDIISSLIILDKININEQIDVLPEDERRKYVEILRVLSEVGLVEIEGNFVLPGNILIELESRFDRHEEILERALAHFFEVGYEYIDTIRMVLGPYLIITRGIYEISLESGELVPLEYNTIKSLFEGEYVPSQARIKLLKLPRYLLQLERVKLVKYVRKDGKDCWIGTEDTFKKLLQNEDISKFMETIIAEF